MSRDRAIAPALTVAIPAALTVTFYDRGYLMLAVVAGILVLIGAALRQGNDAELRWTVATASRSPASAPARGSVALSLARVEARELLLSPWFGAGVGFCVMLGSLSISAFERSWWVSAALLPLLVHPLCGMTIIATHRNVTRSRRDDVEELYDSCPADTTQRTGAHLLTALVPVAVAIVFVSVALGGAAIVLEHIYGPFDDRVIADAVLAGILLPAGATAFGVLLGRRARFALAPFVALAAIALLDLEMADRGLDGRGWLATAVMSGKLDFIYVEPPVFGRLLWIGGLGVLVVGLALVSTRPAARAVVLAGAFVAAAGLVLTVKPLGADTVDRLTDYVQAPQGHEVCRTVSRDVDVCALSPYRDHGANVANWLEPVAAAIPDGLIDGPITMRFLVGDGVGELPNQVQERIVASPVPPGTVAMPFSHHDGSLDEARFILAATAAGLETGADAPENVLVDGQARGIVVLWLATAGLDDDVALDLLGPDQYNDGTPSGQGHIWPGTCGATVQWAPQDLVAGRSMVGVDRDIVGELLASDWERWTDPATSTDDLMIALGLPTVGPPDPIEPLGSTC